MALLSQPIVLMLAVGLYAGVGLVVAFIWLENRGRPEVAVGVIFGSLILQLLVYPFDDLVPTGIFRPGPLRVQELLIGAALVARFLSRNRLGSVSPTGFAWFMFCAWYGTAAVMGGLLGNPLSVVLFHGKFIVYAGGCYLLASGIPVKRLVDGAGLRRLVLGVGAVVAVQLGVTVSNASGVLASLPARAAPDAASLYFGFAVLVIVVEAARRGSRLRTVLAGLPLLATPLVVTQRASVLHFVSSLLFLVVVASGPTWWRRMNVRPTHLLLAVMFVLLLASLAILPKLSEGGPVVPAKVTGIAGHTFGGLAKAESAGARRNSWSVGWAMVAEQPLIGSGLGTVHRYFQPGVGYASGSTFDNTPLDLLVRSGVIGLLLFSWAMLASMRDAWRVWMQHVDPQVAALGLAVAAFLVGLTAKAIVETVLEKVVLACALGIAIGMVASARADVDRADSQTALLSTERTRA